MRVLKTILKWVLPSGKFAYKMLAANAEVFCRHAFGRRYAPTLLASLIFAFLALNLIRLAEPQASPGLINRYLLIYFLVVLYHLIQMWRQRATTHSYSSGQSWEIWARYRLNPNLVKTLIEPLMLGFAGMLVNPSNHILSLWLYLCAGCLCAKELISKWRFNNRVMDSIDARLEGERIGAGVRNQTTPQVARGQAASPVTMAEPAAPTVDSVRQMYSALDPELQRLVRAPAQTQPGYTAANPPAAPLVIIRNQRRAPGHRPAPNEPRRQTGVPQPHRRVVQPAARSPEPPSFPR